MRKVAIFCLTIMMLVMVGCGNDAEQKEEPKVEQEKEYEIETDEQQENQDSIEQGVNEEVQDEPITLEANYLKQLKIIQIPVEATADTDKSKYYAFVRADKELAKNISEQEYIEFCNDCVRNSGYRYFAIDFQDETGIVYVSCVPEAGMYGKIDETRSMIEANKYIGIDENGSVTVTE